MAEKRMFSKKIIDTDWFMDMPATTQNLYFHLSMRADDDGFVASPKRIIKLVGASEDDYKLLIAKKFIIPFDSGVCVITDWRINNYLRIDRHTETIYQDELNKLEVDENGRYVVGIPNGIPSQDTISNSLSNTNTNTNIIIVEDNKEEKEILKKNTESEFIDSFEFSEKVKSSILDWLRYKKEKHQTYKPTGLKTLLKKLKEDTTLNGDEYVIQSIEYSMTSNYSGIYAPRQNNYNNTFTSQNKTNTSSGYEVI